MTRVCPLLPSLLLLLTCAHAFVPFVHQRPLSALKAFDVRVDLPGKQIEAFLKVKPILSVPSEIVEVRYKIPFGLNVEPKKGLAVCTKDGEGGEQVGDVLRYTSRWALGLPTGDGLVTTAASFAGGLSWQCTMFDVMKADAWEQVVEALVSNTPDRTDEVVLLFERALQGKQPEQA